MNHNIFDHLVTYLSKLQYVFLDELLNLNFSRFKDWQSRLSYASKRL